MRFIIFVAITIAFLAASHAAVHPRSPIVHTLCDSPGGPGGCL